MKIVIALFHNIFYFYNILHSNGKTHCPGNFYCLANYCRHRRVQVYEADQVQAFVDSPFIVVCVYGREENNSAFRILQRDAFIYMAND